MTIADLITNIRLELGETDTSRFEDGQLLLLVRKGIARVNAILFRHRIPLAQKTYKFSTVADQADYALPSDFGAPVLLSRDDSKQELTQQTIEEWRNAQSSEALSIWAIKPDDDNNIKLSIKGTPKQVVSMHFDYWPNIDTSEYTTETPVPWSGHLDYVLGDYVKMLAQNIDEMDFSQDAALARELEVVVMEQLQAWRPLVIGRARWNK